MRPAPRTPRREPVDTTTTRAIYLPYPLFQRCREYADRYGIQHGSRGAASARRRVGTRHHPTTPMGEEAVSAPKPIRYHRPDEEPDVDEVEQDWREYERCVRGTCERCGHEGHEGKDCPTITPLLLRNEDC